jgi:hypothetical protein
MLTFLTLVIPSWFTGEESASAGTTADSSRIALRNDKFGREAKTAELRSAGGGGARPYVGGDGFLRLRFTLPGRLLDARC